MFTLLWILIAASAVVLIIGGWEWFEGRGHQLFVGGIVNFAMALVLALGDGHALWRYSLLALVGILSVHTFIKLRAGIRWSRPPLVFAVGAVLLIGIIELVPGLSNATVRILLYATVAFTALFLGSCLWSFERSRRPAPVNSGSTP